jgi:hypothetical protein
VINHVEKVKRADKFGPMRKKYTAIVCAESTKVATTPGLSIHLQMSSCSNTGRILAPKLLGLVLLLAFGKFYVCLCVFALTSLDAGRYAFKENWS